MTVQNNLNKHIYIGDGEITEFPYTFTLHDESHMKVYVVDLEGNETLLEGNYEVDMYHYKVIYPLSGDPLPPGHKLILYREVPVTQEMDLTNQGALPNETLERAYDKLTLIAQQHDEAIKRSLKASLAHPGGVFDWPVPAPGKVVGWNADGTGMANYDNPGEASRIAREAADRAEAAAATVADATYKATPNALIRRDANGRAKVAAPVEEDDIARKAEVDAIKAEVDAYTARIYNAANYGLDGAGINAAITDAYNNGGGIVIIDCIFDVKENIILKPNVSLVGLPGNKINLTNRVILTDGQPYEFNCVIEGLNLEYHKDSGAISSPIEIVGLDAANRCSNIIIRDNVIKCNERGNNGIKIDYAEKIEIYNNAIYDSGQGCGILINNSSNVDVYNNKVYNSGRGGIQVFANCEYIRIHDNYVYSWMLRREITDGGIDSYGPYNSYISIYNNIVDTGTEQAMGGARNHTLIRMQGVHGCYVKNNILIVQSPTVGQVMRVSERDESEISDGVVFEGNEIYLKTDAQYIFRGEYTKDWTIRNNKVYSLGGVCLTYVIEVRNDIEELLIDGNEFKDDLTRPLISVYPTGVKLSNLRIINNTFINQSSRLAILNDIDYPVNTLMICNNRIKTSYEDAVYIYPGIGKLMITNNYVQCGSGGTPIANKGTLGEGNEIIKDNFEVASSS